MPNAPDNTNWRNEELGNSYFPPADVDSTNVNDYKDWAKESGGWHKLLAAVKGGAAVHTDEGRAFANSAVNPQSLADASGAFLTVLDTLRYVEEFLLTQSRSIAGEGKGWQGQAADAFLAEMEYFAKFVGAQADRIEGSAGTGGLNSVPGQLFDNANWLVWAQNAMTYLDSSWAAVSRENGAAVGSDGLVSITNTEVEAPMTAQMLQVVDMLAEQYHMTYNAVDPPDRGDSLGGGKGNGGPGGPKPPAMPNGGGGGGAGGGGGGGGGGGKVPNIPPPPGTGGGGGAGGAGGGAGIKVPNIPPPPGTGGGGTGIKVPDIPPPPGTGGGGTGIKTPTMPPPPGTGGGGVGGGPKPGAPGNSLPRTLVPPTIPKPPATGGGAGGGAGGGTGGGAGGVKPPVAPSGGIGGGVGGVKPPVAPGTDLSGVKPPVFPGGPGKAGLGGGAGGPGSGAGYPGAPASSPPPGGAGGGVSLPDAPDAGGLLEGDKSDWQVPAVDDVNAPAAPGGTLAGGSGLGGSMPGMPGGPSGGSPSGGGVSLPEAPDAGGLLEGEKADWQAPATDGVDAPAAPGGTLAGGSGLGGSMPGMPGGPFGGSPSGAGGGGLPDAPEAGGLLEGEKSQWHSVGAGAVEGPVAPQGTAPGGSGLAGQPGVQLPAVPPVSVPPPTVPSPSGPVAVPSVIAPAVVPAAATPSRPATPSAATGPAGAASLHSGAETGDGRSAGDSPGPGGGRSAGDSPGPGGGKPAGDSPGPGGGRSAGDSPGPGGPRPAADPPGSGDGEPAEESADHAVVPPPADNHGHPLGVVAPVVGAGLVAATNRRGGEGDGQRDDDRPGTSELLTEQAGRWATPAPAASPAGGRVPLTGGRLPMVGADEQGGGSSDWDDTAGTWWLTGDNSDDDRNDDA